MAWQTVSKFGAVRAVLSGCLRLWLTWAWLMVLAGLAVVVVLVAAWDAAQLAQDVKWAPAGPVEVGQPARIVQYATVSGRSPLAERIVWLWPPLALIGGCVTALVLAEHFAGYRWRLVPGYRPVCLAAGAIFGAASLLITGALFTVGWPERLGMSGLAILAFALGCWSVARPWALFVCLALLVVFTPLTGFFPDVARVFAAIAGLLFGDPLFGLLWPNFWPKSNGGGTRALIIVWICVVFLFRLISFQRRSTLAVESLRPVTRSGWVLQSGAALLSRLAGVIAILAICTALGVGPPDNSPPEDSSLPASLAWSLGSWFLSTSALVASVGLIAWLRTVGPLALEIVAAVVGFYACLFLAGMSGMPAAIRADFGAKAIGLLAALAVGLLIAGLAFFRLAYRRWLSIDLE